VSQANWLAVTSGATGNGNGKVHFTAAANNGAARSGSITIAGQTFNVTQEGNCLATISPAANNFAASGGVGTVNVTTAAGCAWTASSNANWLTITGANSGSGNGALNYAVAANTGAARTGTLAVAGQVFTINQAAGCSFTINPATQSFAAMGGSGSVNVTTGTNCVWTATSNASWLTITSGPSLPGAGTVKFTVAMNTGAQRTGTLTMAGQTFTVAQAAAGALASVSAASYAANPLAQESIVAAFGVNLANATQTASDLPLPTELSGTYITVRDAAGVARRAPLFFVSPNQVNYQIPPGTAAGAAQITLLSDSGIVALGTLSIANTAPGLFTANANGQGVPAGVVLRVRGTTQLYENLLRYDAATQRFVSAPIDLGPATETVVLVLFGTGMRHRTALDKVTVRIGTEPNAVSAPVLYAGPAPGFIGLDQLNVTLPRTLLGRGAVNLQLTVDGKTANVVQINVK
jgi:uncharacterized protein (TIGR03437 family)